MDRSLDGRMVDGSLAASASLSLDPVTGDPLRPDGTRYGMVERHPFVPSAHPARVGLCHLCNGARSYIAHSMTRCHRAETTRDCPFSHDWANGHAYMQRSHI